MLLSGAVLEGDFWVLRFSEFSAPKIGLLEVIVVNIICIATPLLLNVHRRSTKCVCNYSNMFTGDNHRSWPYVRRSIHCRHLAKIDICLGSRKKFLDFSCSYKTALHSVRLVRCSSSQKAGGCPIITLHYHVVRSRTVLNPKMVEMFKRSAATSCSANSQCWVKNLFIFVWFVVTRQ